MLQKATVSNKVLDLVKTLMKKIYLNDFFLVGGTGLALQIGHRESIDIDLFTMSSFDNTDLIEKLENDFQFELDHTEKNTIKGVIDGVKVDLLTHPYHLINNIIEDEGIRIASKEDISAMKLNAISNDGSRVKDFIDIYFLLEVFSLEEILNHYEKKYTLRNSMHALKSLNYFKDVDISDWPVLIQKETNWEKIKRTIDLKSTDFINLKKR